MGGYYGDDMDEFEDDGFIEYEEEEEQKYEEEEVWKPTKEELDFFEQRQRIKDGIYKKKMNKEQHGAGANGNSQESKKELPFDNFGSFFGPSRPVIAQRVIQESKLLVENQRLAAARVSNASKKTPASASGSGTSMSSGPPKVVNVKDQKLQKLKESRDYSFLFSDDAKLPAPSKAKNVPVTNSDSRLARAPVKDPKTGSSSSSRPVPNGREQRTPQVSVNQQMLRKSEQRQKVVLGSTRLPNSSSRKQLGSNAVKGRRPLGTKGLPSKMPVQTKTPNKTSIPNKVPASAMGNKRPMPPLSKSNSSEQMRREIRGEPDRGRIMSKKSVSSSRPPKQNPCRAPMQNVRPKKKRPATAMQLEDEDEDAMNELRRITGYNPNRYAGVYEDDSDMEANFHDIQKEEKRSAKIARLEDEREARLGAD